MPEKNIIKVRKILVVGLGLIGASLSRDLKNNSKYEKIYGYDHDHDVMQYAKDNNFVHNIKKDLNEGIADSDLIVLCVPVHSIINILDEIKIFFNGEKVFTDTLSNKNIILKFLRDNKISNTKNFILSHPMAGTENYSIKNSQENLFNEATTFICPLEYSDESKVEEVKSMWRSVNSNTINIDASNHDKLLTVLSHGPHAISFALSKFTNRKGLFDEMPWSSSKGSLAEMVRVASSDPVAWASIFDDNQDNLILYIDEYLEELNKLKIILKSKKPEDLLNYLVASKQKNTKLK
tara:strand:+ start:112 stop:990 length:879 start_codon:yes stop_codon:yes gene_type:complete